MIVLSPKWDEIEIPEPRGGGFTEPGVELRLKVPGLKDRLGPFTSVLKDRLAEIADHAAEGPLYTVDQIDGDTTVLRASARRPSDVDVPGLHSRVERGLVLGTEDADRLNGEREEEMRASDLRREEEAYERAALRDRFKGQ